MSVPAIGLCLAVVGASAQVPRPGEALAPLPLTQLDERSAAPDLDNRTFSLTFAQPVPIRDVLLMLVRGTSLSVAPDPSITGTFIGELRDVTVRQALDLALPPLGLDYTVDDRFVRVFRTTAETRMFDINFLAGSRTGTTSVGGTQGDGSRARIETTSGGDPFEGVDEGVGALLSERGLAHVDRTAGLLQVTDLPDRLDRVGFYLETLHERALRQVQIDARVIEIELSDPEAASLDWNALALRDNTVATTTTRPGRSGLRVDDITQFLARLGDQGRTRLLASPRLLVTNNQPALVRSESRTSDDDRSDPELRHSITLGVVPQIASDGIVMLSISPIVTVAESAADNRNAALARTTREVDTLAMVPGGETIVVSGFVRERQTRERRGGFFSRSQVVTRRVELLILLTPTILDPLRGD